MSTTAAAACEWPGRHVDVGTDASRLAVVSDGFVDEFNESPLAAEGALRRARAMPRRR